jgi:superfamily II DNA/RNA helicase
LKTTRLPWKDHLVAQHAPRSRPARPNAPAKGAPRADRRAGADAAPRADRPRAERWERTDRPRAERTDRPRADRFERSDRPRTERPAGERWERADRPGTDRPDRPYRGKGRPADRRDDRRPRTPRPAPVPPLTGPNAFVDLGVPASYAAILATQQITEPTPIQALTIPAALAGRDVLGRGRTGSGKTLSFGLPMLTRLAGPRNQRRQPRGLILAPTRELAMQVVDALKPLAEAHAMRIQLVIGGSSYDRQIRGLERADVVVATPGRLVDLSQRGSVDLGAIQMVVIDEADHMADLGFMPEIEAIMTQLPEDAQGLLFSATLDHDVDRLVRTYLHDPVVHSADPATLTVGTMAHHLVLVHPKDKDAVTTDIARRRGRTVAFVRTQLGADRLAGQLEAEGVRTAALHGGMKQGMRTRTLDDFRAGRIDVLVATDVAARGIHVDDVDLVLHVDPPHGPKEYLHRSGRTARAGASGTVISLTTTRQQRQVHAITAKAGVTPAVLRARPGDEALRELVG